jgi:hypothetical protein
MNLDELEHAARTLSYRLEALGKLPAGFTIRHYPLTTGEQQELRRLKTAGHAATDAATYVALARGEPVPAHRLDQRLVTHHLRRTRPR